MFIDPTGAVVAQAGHDEEILFYEIGRIWARGQQAWLLYSAFNSLRLFTDLNVAHKIRNELPLFTARRKDVYEKYDGI